MIVAVASPVAAEEKADFSRVPGVVIDHLPAKSGQYVGSPSLAILPGGAMVASHDFFGPKSTEHQSAVSAVFRSDDRGRSWRKIATIDGQFWSTLFVHRGALYLMGTHAHYGNAIIRRSDDAGQTWTTPRDGRSGLLRTDGRFHCAPVPVVEHNGRLWRAMEDTVDPKRWGKSFRAFMMSIPVDADLLRADNWVCSNRLPGDPAWLGGGFGGWLEGNAVVDRQGNMLDILRVDTPGYPEKAALVSISPDGLRTSFDPQTGFVDCPGGAKKFTIRYDAPSDRYWSLATWVPPKRQGLLRPGVMRNTLALICSADLRKWTVRGVLLEHPDFIKHGFQYVDWLLDGDDIVAACRTAYDDGLGGAHNNHDANFLTFHRIKNFRTWSGAGSQPGPRRATLAIPKRHDPCVAWGCQRLWESLLAAGYEEKLAPDGTMVHISIDPSQWPGGKKPVAESFRISATPQGISVAGADAAGAMYACLELAARVQREGELPQRLELVDGPQMSLRGTCILLMKLGTYDYPVTPKEFPFFYDRKLWTEYLDVLAANRFNYIAFWNGHPFDYFVRLPKYPEAQAGLDPGLLERNHEMLAWLANEARRRNIWLLFQFYNIHTSVYFQKAHKLPAWNPKPTPLLADYTSHCIERFVSEFPGVGLYVCPGEALQLEYTDSWIKDVILAAVKRTGKTPPVMVRAWAIDLPHMQKLAGSYPRLYTERKFNVEMVASTEVDPENRAWSKITGNHVVNVHCVANLEPFRWSPPAFIQRCVQSSLVEGGATGLHLYPRKAWRWPYGCDRTVSPELQWRRDWMWFEAWGRYAWRADRVPADERAYWTARLAERFGPAAAPHLLAALEDSADVLPGIQRLLWIGNDNHTVVSAGALLEQIQKAPGIPFLKAPEVMRIPQYIASKRSDVPPAAGSPMEFLAQHEAAAEKAWRAAKIGAREAVRNQAEAQRLATDLEAQLYVARFYRDKVQAAVGKALHDAGIDRQHNRGEWLGKLAESINDFRRLTDLTRRTYQSISDVPAWNPTTKLPCPYHWTDLLPLYERELADQEKAAGRAP